MKYPTRTILALLGTAALAACGSNRNADQNASAEVNAEAGMNASNAAENPFADAMMRMDQKMMAAVGTDVGDNWVRKMIEHHQGAVDMSRIVLQENPTPEVAKMAQDTTDKQSKEIEDLRKLIKDGPADQKSAELYRPAMMDMKAAMSSANGSNPSQTYLLKMLAHHHGAIAMSDIALRNGVSGAIKAQVEKTKASQQKDSAMIEAMLGGKPMNMSDANMSGNMSGMDMNGMAMNGMNHM